MNRRELFYSLLGVSSIPAFVEAQSKIAATGDDLTILKLTPPDAIASGILQFFNAAEFATFKRFGDAMMPAVETEPGALTAKAPEFLDFLLSESPLEVQTLYRNGVRELDRKSSTRYKRSFSSLEDAEIQPILAPLSEPWSFKGPADPFAQFLLAGKLAFWEATLNSREWAQANAGRRRGAAGVNSYYLPVE